MLFVVAAMVVFFFIKPTIEKRGEYQAINEKKEETIEEEASVYDRIPANYR
jgi:hypothetical protein